MVASVASQNEQGPHKHWLISCLFVYAAAIYFCAMEFATLPRVQIILGLVLGVPFGTVLMLCHFLAAFAVKKLRRDKSYVKPVYWISGSIFVSVVLFATLSNSPKQRLSRLLPNHPTDADVFSLSGYSFLEFRWAARFRAPAAQVHRMIEANRWQFLGDFEKPDDQFIFVFSKVAQARYEDPGRAKCYGGRTEGYSFKAYVGNAGDLVLIVISR